MLPTSRSQDRGVVQHDTSDTHVDDATGPPSATQGWPRAKWAHWRQGHKAGWQSAGPCGSATNASWALQRPAGCTRAVEASTPDQQTADVHGLAAQDQVPAAANRWGRRQRAKIHVQLREARVPSAGPPIVPPRITVSHEPEPFPPKQNTRGEMRPYLARCDGRERGEGDLGRSTEHMFLNLQTHCVQSPPNTSCSTPTRRPH